MFFFRNLQAYIYDIYLLSLFQTLSPLIHYNIQQLQNSWSSVSESVMTIAEKIIAEKWSSKYSL